MGTFSHLFFGTILTIFFLNSYCLEMTISQYLSPKKSDIIAAAVAVTLVGGLVGFYYHKYAKNGFFKKKKITDKKVFRAENNVREEINPFLHIMGIKEEDFMKLSAKDREKYIDREKGVLKNPNTNKSYSYGSFELISVEELDKKIGMDLRELFASYREKNNKKEEEEDGVKLVFNVLTTRQKNSLMTSASTIQGDGDFHKAIFQVASNFNCIEGGEIPVYMDRYTEKMAQGECCALSSFAAAIYRTYFVPHIHNKVREGRVLRRYKVGQVEKQLNLLDDLNLFLNKGYLDEEAYKDILGTDWSQQPNFYKRILVGIHRNVSVNFVGIRANEKKAFMKADIVGENNGNKITQILTATTNINKARNYLSSQQQKRQIQTRNLKNFTSGCLRAAYDGTLATAIKYGQKKVVLTLVGGGVFKNEPQWILDALRKSLKKYQQYGLEVTLLMYEEDKDYALSLKRLTENYRGEYAVVEDEKLEK